MALACEPAAVSFPKGPGLPEARLRLSNPLARPVLAKFHANNITAYSFSRSVVLIRPGAAEDVLVRMAKRSRPVGQSDQIVITYFFLPDQYKARADAAVAPTREWHGDGAPAPQNSLPGIWTDVLNSEAGEALVISELRVPVCAEGEFSAALQSAQADIKVSAELHDEVIGLVQKHARTEEALRNLERQSVEARRELTQATERVDAAKEALARIQSEPGYKKASLATDPRFVIGVYVATVLLAFLLGRFALFRGERK